MYICICRYTYIYTYTYICVNTKPYAGAGGAAGHIRQRPFAPPQPTVRS